MSSLQHPIFNSVLLRIKDQPQRSAFQCIQITRKQVDEYILSLRRLKDSYRRQYLEGYVTWTQRHSSLFEDFEVEPSDIDDFVSEQIQSEDDDEARILFVFSFAALCIWIYSASKISPETQHLMLVNQGPEHSQEEHKAPDVDFSEHMEVIQFETVTDVLERMYFVRHLMFSMKEVDTENLWKILLPDRSHPGYGKPIHLKFKDHDHRNRRRTKPIKSITEDLPETPLMEHSVPLLKDKPFSFLHGMVNGLLHQVSTNQSEYSGKLLAFSIEAEFEGDSNVPQWFPNSVEQSARVLEQEMNEWNTMEWSELFGRLYAVARNDRRWFVMRKIDRRIRAKLLLDEMGFEILRPNLHDKMTEISQKWKSDYITLYVWPVGSGSPRVYLDFNGFRVRIRSTLDVRVFLNSICRVIQIDTTDPVYDTNAKAVVNRLVERRSTVEFIEGTRIARMIFSNQKHFLEAQRKMDSCSCFSTFWPREENLTKDTVEVGEMDDPVFDSVERAIQSRPDFINKSFRKMANKR